MNRPQATMPSSPQSPMAPDKPKPPRPERILGPLAEHAESAVVELKESGIDDALADICAFANTAGGTVYLGVANSGHVIVGYNVSDEHQRAISQKVRSKLQIDVAIHVLTVEGHSYLGLLVTPKKKPVYLRQLYYIRVGTETVAVGDPADLTTLILGQTNRSWDSLSADMPVADSIDRARLAEYVSRAQGRHQPRLTSEVQPDHPVEQVLRHIADGLVIDSDATNAAILLFGRQPQRLAAHARIKIASFRSIDDFTIYPDCVGTVFEQIDAALRIVMGANPPHISFPRSTDASADVAERTRRRETPIYDELAIKEAIANAVVHRDYTVAGADIEIKMFEDRLVVLNPGPLPPQLTLAMLRENPHPSLRRNPLIAQACFVDHYVERYGTGTVRMIERCRNAALPEPVFSLSGKFFKVTFFKDPLRPGRLEALDLNPRQYTALAHVREHGRIDGATYASLVGGTRSARARDLEDLVRQDLLLKVGTRGPGVHWVPMLPGQTDEGA